MIPARISRSVADDPVDARVPWARRLSNLRNQAGWSRRRVSPVALAILLACLSALVACSDEPEDYEGVGIGTNARTSSTDAMGFALVVDGKGNGRVVGTLVNNSREATRLVDASVTTEQQAVEVRMPRGAVTLPPDETVQLANLPAISVESTTPEDLPAGMLVELTLEIEGGEPLEFQIPVKEQKGPYADVEVTAPPDGDIAPE